VTEIFGLTSLTNVTCLTVCASDSTAVVATVLNLPLLDQAEYEAYEGMLVTVPGELSLTDSFYLHRFGEVVLSVQGKQFTPTNLRLPGPEASDLNENPYLGPGNTLRLGDTVTDLTGVLSYGFGNYRLQPTESIEFFRANPRPEPPDVGGGLKVAAFNLRNYWTTIDDGANKARGADSPAEFNRQRSKSVAALVELDADVVGLQELENNGPTAISSLVDALNEATAPDTWRFVPTPHYPGGLETTDAIKVGLIYKTGRLSPIGDPVAGDDPIFGSDRPPVAQSFEANGERFTLVVNHFKSKNCDGASDLDLDQNDGQGCYNGRRTLQAKALLNFVARLQETTKDEDVLVIGDFNAYVQEDPIAVLNSGLTNLFSDSIPQQDQYSYAYFGQLGLLDHAFATSRLADRVTGAGIWHINADEPRSLSFNDIIVDPSEDDGDQILNQHLPLCTSVHDFPDSSTALALITRISSLTIQAQVSGSYTSTDPMLVWTGSMLMLFTSWMMTAFCSA
jgi:predicted extracellular nuclease